VPPVRLFIGNLPYQATEDDLRSHFSAVGEPTQIVRPLDRETGRARGFAFVEYAERANAEEAIKRFDGQLFMGRPLAVSEARARDDRGPAGPPRPSSGFPPRPGGGFPPRPGGFSPGGPPRPGGGFAPRPGGPSAPGSGGPPGRDFGPPAPPKNKKGAKGGFRKEEQKPRGPIPTKFTGRMYDLDDVAAEEDALDDLPDFMKPDEVEPSDEDASQAVDTADVQDETHEPDGEHDGEHDDDK
jgi:RNA recognition motif-containing protein